MIRTPNSRQILAIACRACAETRRPVRASACLRAPCVIATIKLKLGRPA